MKEHNHSYKDVSVSIKCVANGFIVEYKNNAYCLEQKIFSAFTDAVNEMARHLGLTDVGETLEIVDGTSED